MPRSRPRAQARGDAGRAAGGRGRAQAPSRAGRGARARAGSHRAAPDRGQAQTVEALERAAARLEEVETGRSPPNRARSRPSGSRPRRLTRSSAQSACARCSIASPKPSGARRRRATRPGGRRSGRRAHTRDRYGGDLRHPRVRCPGGRTAGGFPTTLEPEALGASPEVPATTTARPDAEPGSSPKSPRGRELAAAGGGRLRSTTRPTRSFAPRPVGDPDRAACSRTASARELHVARRARRDPGLSRDVPRSAQIQAEALAGPEPRDGLEPVLLEQPEPDLVARRERRHRVAQMRPAGPRPRRRSSPRAATRRSRADEGRADDHAAVLVDDDPRGARRRCGR